MSTHSLWSYRPQWFKQWLHQSSLTQNPGGVCGEPKGPNTDHWGWTYSSMQPCDSSVHTEQLKSHKNTDVSFELIRGRRQLQTVRSHSLECLARSAPNLIRLKDKLKANTARNRLSQYLSMQTECSHSLLWIALDAVIQIIHCSFFNPLTNIIRKPYAGLQHSALNIWSWICLETKGDTDNTALMLPADSSRTW